MPLPQVPPGGGGRRPRTHFGYAVTPGGRTWTAYIAGPCHWYFVHSKGKTKPCLHEMTDGKLACPKCAVGQIPEEVGYQPLYRELDSKPVMVIVHWKQREAIDCLRFKQRVIVGRNDGASDPVYIVPALKPTPAFESTLADRNRPADLEDTLLAVWAIPELTEYIRAQNGPLFVSNPTPVPAVPPPPPPPPKVKAKLNGREFAPPALSAADEVGQLMHEGSGFDEALRIAEERAFLRAAKESSAQKDRPKPR